MPRATKKQRRYEFKQAVLRTSRLLQGLPPKRQSRQRTPRLSKADASMLAELEARVRTLSQSALPHLPLRQDGDAGSIAARVSAAVAAQLQDVESLRDPDACCCRGPGSRADYLHGKKRPQVEWMLTAICSLVAKKAAVCAAHDSRGWRLQILDVGGGRGDLALCTAAALPTCDVTVVDTNAKSVADGEARAARSGLKNIRFICADAAKEMETLGHGRSAPTPDLLIGLHACGGLTDLILWLATLPRRHCADGPPEPGADIGASTVNVSSEGDKATGCRFPSFLVVPCCFNKHPQLISRECKWATAAPNDICLSPMEVATLQRLAESNERSTSHRAMLLINLLRLEAVRMARQRATTACTSAATRVQGETTDGAGLWLMEFSETYSLRNMVLCGDGDV
eukprot:SAG31_NODE_4611_length_3098_cov_1.293098_2_plen_398_part_00